MDGIRYIDEHLVPDHLNVCVCLIILRACTRDEKQRLARPTPFFYSALVSSGR